MQTVKPTFVIGPLSTVSWRLTRWSSWRLHLRLWGRAQGKGHYKQWCCVSTPTLLCVYFSVFSSPPSAVHGTNVVSFRERLSRHHVLQVLGRGKPTPTWTRPATLGPYPLTDRDPKETLPDFYLSVGDRSGRNLPLDPPGGGAEGVLSYGPRDTR